jgi:hypothetical protein
MNISIRKTLAINVARIQAVGTTDVSNNIFTSFIAKTNMDLAPYKLPARSERHVHYLLASYDVGVL